MIEVESVKGGFLLSPPSPKDIGILLHGYGQSAGELMGMGQSLAQSGHQIFLPNLPGHGDHPHIFNASNVLLFINDCLFQLKASRLTPWAIGFSLGARIAQKMSTCIEFSSLCMISPPLDQALTKETKKELLGTLRMRWVREIGPMVGLKEVLGELDMEVGNTRSLIVKAKSDLSAVDEFINQWATVYSQPEIQVINNADHMSICHHPETIETIGRWHN